MSRRARVISSAARTRQQRKMLRAELERACELTAEGLRQAVEEGLIAGRIEDGQVIIEVDAPEPATPRRTP